MVLWWLDYGGCGDVHADPSTCSHVGKYLERWECNVRELLAVLKPEQTLKRQPMSTRYNHKEEESPLNPKASSLNQKPKKAEKQL